MSGAELTGCSYKSQYHFSFRFELSFDIEDPSLNFLSDGMELPLTGNWLVGVKRTEDDLLVTLYYGNVSEGMFGSKVKLDFNFFQVDYTGRSHLIDHAAFDAAPLPSRRAGKDVLSTKKSMSVNRSKWLEKERRSNGRYHPPTHRHYRLLVEVEEDFPEDPYATLIVAEARARQSGHDAGYFSGAVDGQIRGKAEGYEQGRKEGLDVAKQMCEDAVIEAKKEFERIIAATQATFPQLLASRVSGEYLHPDPYDIRLVFPAAGDRPVQELWAKSAQLASHSSYFASLLSSEFAESVVHRTGVDKEDEKRDSAPSKAVEKDFDDSDDETDEVFMERSPVKNSSSVAGIPYRQVIVTQTAFSTYHAVLVFLETSFLTFSPLSSSFPTSSHPTRRDFLLSSSTASPSLPLPVSPKSIYRLADFLDLPELKKLALSAFTSSLTPAGVAKELFSDFTQCYKEPREVVLGFLKERWEEVKETKEWKELVKRIEEDEVDGVGPVLLALMRMGISL